MCGVNERKVDFGLGGTCRECSDGYEMTVTSSAPNGLCVKCGLNQKTEQDPNTKKKICTCGDRYVFKTQTSLIEKTIADLTTKYNKDTNPTTRAKTQTLIDEWTAKKAKTPVVQITSGIGYECVKCEDNERKTRVNEKKDPTDPGKCVACTGTDILKIDS